MLRDGLLVLDVLVARSGPVVVNGRNDRYVRDVVRDRDMKTLRSSLDRVIKYSLKPGQRI